MHPYGFFHDNQKLAALYFHDDATIEASHNTTITVIMENGQMGSVPWAIVEGPSGCHKWNLSLVLGVTILKENQDE